MLGSIWGDTYNKNFDNFVGIIMGNLTFQINEKRDFRFQEETCP